jgi:hypothetical protein
MFFVSHAPERGKSGNNSTTSHHAPSASHAQLGGVEIDEHFCLGGSYGVNASGTRNVLFERTMPRQSVKSRSYLAFDFQVIRAPEWVNGDLSKGYHRVV